MFTYLNVRQETCLALDHIILVCSGKAAMVCVCVLGCAWWLFAVGTLHTLLLDDLFPWRKWRWGGGVGWQRFQLLYWNNNDDDYLFVLLVHVLQQYLLIL